MSDWITELQNPKLVKATKFLSVSLGAASDALENASEALSYASTAVRFFADWQEQGAEVKSDG